MMASRHPRYRAWSLLALAFLAIAAGLLIESAILMLIGVLLASAATLRRQPSTVDRRPRPPSPERDTTQGQQIRTKAPTPGPDAAKTLVLRLSVRRTGFVDTVAGHGRSDHIC